MDQISIISILTVSIPEAILVLIICLVSIGKFSYVEDKNNYWKIVLFSIVESITIYFVRRNVKDIVEVSLVSFFVLVLFLIFIIRLKFYESILAAFFGFTSLFIIEALCVPLLLPITKLSILSVFTSDISRFFVTLPMRFIQIIIIFVSFKFRIKIVDFENLSVKKREYMIQLFVYVICIFALAFLAIVMYKTLIFNHTDSVDATNLLLLRLNIYISMFLTAIMTIAFKGVTDHYKSKSLLNNNEIVQSLEYISDLAKENKNDEIKDAIEKLKTSIGNSED